MSGLLLGVLSLGPSGPAGWGFLPLMGGPPVCRGRGAWVLVPLMARPAAPPSVDGPKGGVSLTLSAMPCLPIVCVRMRVCVCVCVRARACVCVYYGGWEGGAFLVTVFFFLSLIVLIVNCFNSVKHFVLHICAGKALYK